MPKLPLPTCVLVASSLALAHCSASSSGSGSSGSPTDGGPTDSAAPADAGSRDAADTGSSNPGSDAAGPTDSGPDHAEAGIPCDASSGCPNFLTCCEGFCVDVLRDPRNCGACGNDCTATQFCTGSQCDDAVFANVCANATVTVVDDLYYQDNEAGASIGQSLATSCGDAGVAMSIVSQTQPGVLIPGDAGWQPNTGVGTTLVAGGGYYGQLSVGYMDDHGLSPVYLTNDGTTSHIYQRSTGITLVTAADSTLGAQHDFFFLELAVEPQSGTLCLFGEGIYGAGTVAAGYYGAQVLVPGHASYPQPWYVYEWTDTNGDMTPDQGDTFSLVAKGS